MHVGFICNSLGSTELLKSAKSSEIKCSSQPSPTTMVSTKPPECICLKPPMEFPSWCRGSWHTPVAASGCPRLWSSLWERDCCKQAVLDKPPPGS